MRVWLITRIGETEYDKYAGFVVIAKDEGSARDLAHAEASLGWKDPVWKDPAQSTCVELLPEGEERIVLSDYNAG